MIDLGRLNSVQVSDDESAVSVGSGNTWTNVYSVLEKRGLLTIGGRAGSVGVGGFVLGGKFLYYVLPLLCSSPIMFFSYYVLLAMGLTRSRWDIIPISPSWLGIG